MVNALSLVPSLLLCLQGNCHVGSIAINCSPSPSTGKTSSPSPSASTFSRPKPIRSSTSNKLLPGLPIADAPPSSATPTAAAKEPNGKPAEKKVVYYRIPFKKGHPVSYCCGGGGVCMCLWVHVYLSVCVYLCGVYVCACVCVCVCVLCVLSVDVCVLCTHYLLCPMNSQITVKCAVYHFIVCRYMYMFLLCPYE